MNSSLSKTKMIERTSSSTPHNLIRSSAFLMESKSNQRKSLLERFRPFSSSNRGTRSQLSSTYRKSLPEQDEEESNNDSSDGGGSTPEQRRRLRDWMYSGGTRSPLVQPVQWEDELPADFQQRDKKTIITPKFGSLFAGMPKLSEILGDDDDDGKYNDDDKTTSEPPSYLAGSSVSSRGSPSQPENGVVDDLSWFADEQREIQRQYDTVRNEMMQQLEIDKSNRPDDHGIPSNAGAVLDAVLKQEMAAELRQRQLQRQMERLKSYEQDLIQRNRDVDQTTPLPDTLPDAVLQQYLDQTNDEYARSDQMQRLVDDYQLYEQKVQAAYNESVEKESSVSSSSSGPRSAPPPPIPDVDQWALDRLRGLIDDDSTDNDEASEIIKDILRENLDDLTERMNRAPLIDQSMKEWQMYRAIASRMKDDNNDGSGGGNEKVDEIEILRRMESWKEYVSKEEDVRQRNGLSTESSSNDNDDEQDAAINVVKPSSLSKQARKEQMIQSRKTMNRMSIEALESLLSTTYVARRQRLREEIDFLKATLEQNDYMDVDESMLPDDDDYREPTYDVNAPVDTSQLFNLYKEEKDEKLGQPIIEPRRLPVQNVVESQSSSVPTWRTNEQQQQQRESMPKRSPAPPNTAFFNEQLVSAEPSLSLGSMEDQKLESMYRRAGATTMEERESIRKSYEEFKRMEEARRQTSGLSAESSGDDELVARAGMKYNISAVMKADGDFDAEAVLSAIGPRPTRRKVTATAAISTESDVADSLYRAVSAVGGGRYKDDPEMDAKQKASYLEYVAKEAEVRESLDSDVPLASNVPVVSMDDEEYATKVISALGERPRSRRGRFLSAEELSDRGGLRPGEVDDDEDEEEDDDDDDDFELGLIPEWLRKENSSKRKTMRGNDIVEDAFDDSYYEHNARQVAEFERRRRGLGKAMGIDISDVLGRSNLQSDDYADYKFDDAYTRDTQTDWGSNAFQARKRTLLEYIELDLQEVNSLLDFKNSVYATGFSQYMPRINKPFVEFGAIFRLESVLLDTTGLHNSVWKQLAAANSLPVPTISDVQKAALVRADEAVRDIFFWTSDVRECRRLGERHRELFQSSFEQWLVGSKIRVEDFIENAPAADMTGADNIRETVAVPRLSTRKLTEREFMDKAMAAWSEVADRIGEDPPTEEEIAIAFSVGTEIAVKEIFGWATEMKQVDLIVDMFNEISGISTPEKAKQSPSLPSRKSLTQEVAMETHYRAWLAAAERFRLRPPTEDEVLAAFVINDEEVAANAFGWEGSYVNDAIQFFKLQVKQGLESHGLSPTKQLQPAAQVTVAAPEPAFSTIDYDTQLKVWSTIASNENFASPDNDEILFAMTVGPDDAIVNGFGWASRPDDVRRLVDLYYKELEKETRLPVASRVPPIARLELNEEANMEEIFRGVYDSWFATAQKLGYNDPTIEEVQFAMTVGLEEAIMFGLQWTQNRQEIQKIVEVYRNELSMRRGSWSAKTNPSASTRAGEDVIKVTLKPGASKLTKSLKDVEMPCCVVSNLEQHQMDLLLRYFGLADLFPHRISATDGYATKKDQLLGAALRLERRPDHCVVFDAVPESGATDVLMRSVNLVHPYPRYELVSSDTTAGSLDDLTPINIRRLFAERVSDQTQVDVQQPQEQIQRKTKTAFYYDDD